MTQETEIAQLKKQRIEELEKQETPLPVIVKANVIKLAGEKKRH
jgi:hypothetical protein